jgi:hypothetical protein
MRAPPPAPQRAAAPNPTRPHRPRITQAPRDCRTTSTPSSSTPTQGPCRSRRLVSQPGAVPGARGVPRLRCPARPPSARPRDDSPRSLADATTGSSSIIKTGCLEITAVPLTPAEAPAAAAAAATEAGGEAGASAPNKRSAEGADATPAAAAAAAGDEDGSAGAGAAKRQKTEGQEHSGSLDARQRPRRGAGGGGDGGDGGGGSDRPVCAYLCQLATIPGKFDPAKAAQLGVPKGPVSGWLDGAGREGVGAAGWTAAAAAPPYACATSCLLGASRCRPPPLSHPLSAPHTHTLGSRPCSCMGSSSAAWRSWQPMGSRCSRTRSWTRPPPPAPPSWWWTARTWPTWRRCRRRSRCGGRSARGGGGHLVVGCPSLAYMAALQAAEQVQWARSRCGGEGGQAFGCGAGV